MLSRLLFFQLWCLELSLVPQVVYLYQTNLEVPMISPNMVKAAVRCLAGPTYPDQLNSPSSPLPPSLIIFRAGEGGAPACFSRVSYDVGRKKGLPIRRRCWPRPSAGGPTLQSDRQRTEILAILDPFNFFLCSNHDHCNYYFLAELLRAGASEE